MTSHDRVRSHTAPAVNREIRERAERRIDALRDDPARIRERLGELDREWDVERALAVTSSSISLAGLALGLTGRRRWFYLPVVVQGFFLQHAVQGWCPPLPIFRRLGFRTPKEIERERYTLRALLRDRVGDRHSDRPAELPADRRREGSGLAGEPASG